MLNQFAQAENIGQSDLINSEPCSTTHDLSTDQVS